MLYEILYNGKVCLAWKKEREENSPLSALSDLTNESQFMTRNNIPYSHQTSPNIFKYSPFSSGHNRITGHLELFTDNCPFS